MKKHLSKLLWIVLCAAILSPLAGCCCTAKKTADAAQNYWPDRTWLVQSIGRSIPAILATYRPESGEFGQKPWVCLDQNVMFTLAVAWATESKDNPYYQSPELLKIIAKAGDRLVDAQDANGMWTFRKKDNSTWGQIHMPWTYIRWIRTYSIVKDALPADSKAKWEKGLKLGYSRIVKSCQGKGTHNITALNASGLYLAGMLFNNEEWKETVRSFMERVCAKQTEDGFWSEHHGPVVTYNTYYLEALGLYYSYSRDPEILKALARGSKFHSALLWQDGTSVSIIDERNYYTGARKPGNVGFSFTPEGRQYLLQQLGSHMQKKLLIEGDFAAVMLWNGEQGPAAPAPAAASRYDSKDKMFAVARQAPYQWALSAYHCPVYPVRWIMDRQTHVEIAIDGLGVIGSGGNTKMQPYHSTFTFGNPDSFQPDYTKADPDFVCKTGLRYLPDNAEINGNTVALTYGANKCSVTVTPEKEFLRVTYRLANKPDAMAKAHFPVCIASTLIKPLDAKKVYTGKELNNKLEYRNGLVITLPDDAEIRPKVIGFNPYEKFGRFAPERLVISLPFPEGKMAQELQFSRKINAQLDGAERFSAVEMNPSADNAPFRVLMDTESTVFLRSTQPGGELHLVLNQPKAATREIFLAMNNYNCYGIVQLLVNGKEVGKPFDTYASSLILCEAQALGKVELKKGTNIITLRSVGKNPKSANYFTSIRDIYLK